jgi:hypothetical protein
MEGFPFMRSECAILTPHEKPIDLIVHTPGGLELAASQIAHAVESHKGKAMFIRGQNFFSFIYGLFQGHYPQKSVFSL